METTKKTYKIKIQLLNINPPIWRRILVKPDVLLAELHKIIQTTMGWQSTHLHDFSHGDDNYGIVDEEFGNSDLIDYSNIRLSDVLKEVEERIDYMYDFGDGWEHEIILEGILEAEAEKYYPVCTEGERGCPPEDCGGPMGYEDIVQVLKDPKHPEYEEFKDWVGDYFSPEEFDIETVNELLQSNDFGCLDMSSLF